MSAAAPRRALGLAVALAVGGCGRERSATDPEVVAEARAAWSSRCATCHGEQGRGDGAAGAALSPKPRDFHDRGWQASVDDEHLRRVIVEGGPAVGLSPGMAPNPDLGDRPELVGALVGIVRDFGREP